MTVVILFIGLWFGVCAYALWRGAQPERLVALIFLILGPLSGVAHSLGYQWRGIDLGVFGLDALMLLLLLAIAFRANRYWPIGIAAMQVLQVVGHLLKLADPGMLPMLYWLSSVVWAYPMLVLLLLGTIRHRNRVKRLGPEASWSNFSPQPG